MRALRWHAARDLRLEDLPTPSPGRGEVLVRVDRVGLCGTDLEEYLDGPVDLPAGTPHPRSGRMVPLVTGHEVVGTVAASLGGVVPEGTRVVPDVVLGCGACWWCARHQEGICPQLVVRGMQTDGGLAEFMLADAATLVPVPDGLATDAAAFAEPVSVAVRALRKVPELAAGGTALVVGAGVIGTLITQVAVARGVRVLAVDPVAARRDLAAGAGAEVVAAPEGAAEAVLAATGGRGADVTFECSGVPAAVGQAIARTRRGGTTVLVGFRKADVPFPLLDVVLSEKRLVGTAAHLWDEDVTPAVRLLAAGIVDPRPLLTAVIPLERAVADGFERLAADRSAAKILVDPTA